MLHIPYFLLSDLNSIFSGSITASPAANINVFEYQYKKQFKYFDNYYFFEFRYNGPEKLKGQPQSKIEN